MFVQAQNQTEGRTQLQRRFGRAEVCVLLLFCHLCLFGNVMSLDCSAVQPARMNPVVSVVVGHDYFKKAIFLLKRKGKKTPCSLVIKVMFSLL